MKIKFFHRYAEDKPDTGLSFAGVRSLTKQSHRDEADVNQLVNRFTKTGVFYDRPGFATPQFGDFSSGVEFRDVQNRIAEARQSFETLPAETRKFFDNDPSKLLDFITNPDNADAAAELGILSLYKRSEQYSLDVTVPTDTADAEQGPTEGGK